MALKKITGRFNGNLGVPLGCLQPAANPGNRSSERPAVRGSPSPSPPPFSISQTSSFSRPGASGAGAGPLALAPDRCPTASHPKTTATPRLAPGLVGKRGKRGAKSEGRRRTVPSHAAVSKSALDLLNVL